MRTSYAVEYHVVYRYRRAVRLGPHRLSMRPRETSTQRVVEAALTLQPAGHTTWTVDELGNSIALVEFDAPADRLEIRLQTVVEAIVGEEASWPRQHRNDKLASEQNSFREIGRAHV